MHGFFSFATAVVCPLQQQRNVFLLKRLLCSRDTFICWCSWRSWVYRNENVIWVCSFFFFVDHCSAAMFSMTFYTKPAKMKSLYMFF